MVEVAAHATGCCNARLPQPSTQKKTQTPLQTCVTIPTTPSSWFVSRPGHLVTEQTAGIATSGPTRRMRAPSAAPWH
jgi:hypothetical protein